MSNIFFASDHHFFHESTFKTFKRENGNPLRNFPSSEKMNETIINNHNKVVSKKDIVYFLGDITLNPSYLPILLEMNGEKRLIMGNHDQCQPNVYAKYFDRVYPLFVKYNMIMSHIPLHPDSVHPRFKRNIHGHLHGHVIHNPIYLNVSMEQLNDYMPLSLEEVRDRFQKNEEHFSSTGKVINYAT